MNNQTHKNLISLIRVIINFDLCTPTSTLVRVSSFLHDHKCMTGSITNEQVFMPFERLFQACHKVKNLVIITFSYFIFL